MDIKIKAKESGRKIELNKENPTSHRYGFRCALNISKPDTLQDVKANK